MRRVLTFFGLAGCVYLMLVTGLYVVQRQLLYLPDRSIPSSGREWRPGNVGGSPAYRRRSRSPRMATAGRAAGAAASVADMAAVAMQIEYGRSLADHGRLFRVRLCGGRR